MRSPQNLTVSSVLPQRSIFSGQERVTVATQVVNRGPSAASNVQVHLELDGRNVETRTITVLPGEPASITFQPFTLARAFTRGTVRIGDDRLKQDNAFHFVASPAQTAGGTHPRAAARLTRDKLCICRKRWRSARRRRFR